MFTARTTRIDSMPAGDRRIPATVTIEGESAAAARGHGSGVLSQWGIDEATSSDATLLVTEMVSNAVRHERASQVELTVATDGTIITISVEGESSPSFPDLLRTPAMPPPHATGGRGLALLDLVALRWGIHRQAQVTTTWFTLQPASAIAAQPAPSPASFPIDVPAGSPDLVTAALADARTLLRVCEALARAGDIQELSTVITHRITEELGAMFAGIALRQAGSAMLTYLDLAPLPSTTDARWRTFPLDGTSPAGAAARDGRRFFHPTRVAVEAEFPDIPGHMQIAGVHALANLPLTDDDESIGVMTFAWETEQAFGAHQRASLITVASYVASALRRMPAL